MAKKSLQDPAIIMEKFARSITPQPLERVLSGASNMISWGDNNLYPNFLLKLYEEVPLHQSIVNSKCDYLVGDGLVNKETGDPFEGFISDYDTPQSFVQKVVFDWNLFGWFAVAVQYNIFGRPVSFYHVPVNYVRSNRSRSKFWVCDDWLLNSQNELSYEAYKPGINATKKTTLFVYGGYVPSAQITYPSIRYKSAIVSMVTESLINEFNKNSLEDGFSAAHIISFFKGMPDSVAGKLFTDKVKQAYSGVRGAKYIIDFNNPGTTNNIKVETIETPDYATKLTAIKDINETNILAAHQATSRALFGIQQAAGLNGNDLENAYQIFKKVWVANNRNNVEDGLNRLFSALLLPVVQFKDVGLVLAKTLDAQTMRTVYLIDELRAVDGLPPLPNGDGQKLAPIEKAGSIAASTLPTLPGETPTPPPVAPAPAPGTGAKFSELVMEKKGRILTAEDFELIKDMGLGRSGFNVLDETDFYIQSREDFRRVELLFDDAADVQEWLTKNYSADKSTADMRAAILKDLGIKLTASELNTKIDRLKAANVLEGGEPPKKA